MGTKPGGLKWGCGGVLHGPPACSIIPNVLAVYGVGTEGRTPYLVTELSHGATVSQRLSSGPIPQSKAIEYACQIAQGLAGQSFVVGNSTRL